MDCVEWLRVFRMRYDRATEDGHLETIEALEYLFDALWDGYGGECSKRWRDLIGAPKEDGRKLLNQESPYEDLREWVLQHNDKAVATAPREPEPN